MRKAGGPSGGDGEAEPPAGGLKVDISFPSLAQTDLRSETVQNTKI